MLSRHQQGRTASSSSCSSDSIAVPVPAQPLSQKLASWRHRIQTAQAALHAPDAGSRPVVRSSTRSCGKSSSGGGGSSFHRQQVLTQTPSISRYATLKASSTAAPAASAAGRAAAAAASVLAVGDVVEVSCERLGTGGVGVCPWGRSQLVLLVKGALPGEQLTAVITAVKKNYAEGQKVSTQHPHMDAATPACQHYGTCGGCSLQALSYPAQLAYKVDYVGQILSRVGKLAQADVAAAQQPPVAADAVYGYRNKVQMAFSSFVWQEGASEQQQQQHGSSPGVQGAVQQGFGLGYFLTGSRSVVVPIQECSLASPEMNQVVSQVRQLCQQHGLQPHNAPEGTGVLRHLIVRSAAAAAAATAQGTAPSAFARPLPAAAAAAAALGSSPDSAGAAETGPSVPTATAAAAAGSTPAPVPGGDTPAERKLMAVLVTSPAISSQPQALEALASVAKQLMHSCPSLASVTHSIEAGPAAAAGGGGGPAAGRSKRSASTRSKQGSSRRKGGSSSSSSSNSRASQSDSDSESGGASSSRGAQPLRVQSSQVLAGADSLVEHMCGLQFQVSPHSFFQTNTAQAERLYGLAVQAVAEVVGATSSSSSSSSQPSPVAASGAVVRYSPQQRPYAGGSSDEGVVLDLYCGTGTIALCLASALPDQQVVGFDVSASSISDARANAARNGLDNVSFVCGDLNQLLPVRADDKQAGKKNMYSKQVGRQGKQLEQAPAAAAAVAIGQQEPAVQLQRLQPRVVVVDPARAGLGAGVVQYLLRCGAQRVVYVSCNAATQARDLQMLCGEGVFKLTAWTCVDLFPQTDVAHVETVVVLDRAA